jgi:hypothetical protein
MESDSANGGGPAGADIMKALANTCPHHGQKGYFVINDPSGHFYPKRILNTAAGVSPFCPECMNPRSCFD